VRYGFAFIPRDVYATIPKATSFEDVPFDRWRELNADGLIVGTVQKTANGLHVEMRLYNVRTRQAVYPRQYDGTANPRLYAHTMSDEIHKSQRALNGVARSKLTFDSDRDGERMTGTIQNRNIKEIYIADYDGENQRRVTVGRTLNITPRWSPDARSIAYTSYRRGGANIFIAPVAPGDGVNPPPATPYQGLDHFGLTVSGIDSLVAELKGKGVEFTREPTTVRPGVRVAFLRAPEGVSIELLERNPV